MTFFYNFCIIQECVLVVVPFGKQLDRFSVQKAMCGITDCEQGLMILTLPALALIWLKSTRIKHSRKLPAFVYMANLSGILSGLIWYYIFN